jgi:tyrosine-protein kinase Etk/Wzc
MHLNDFGEIPLREVPREPHVMDLLTRLARRKWAVIGFTFVGGVLFLAFTYLMPHKYSGLSTLVPPEKQTSQSGLFSFLSGSGALDLMKGQENPALGTFKNILDSRQLAEQIAKDSLVRAYYSSWDTSRKAILNAVQQSLESEPLRNGVLNVEVNIKTHWMPSQEEIAKAKQLVPHLANLFVTHLDRYNREHMMTTAKLTRIFIEGEYKERLAQLDTAYANLQAFQEQHKAISLTDQLSATVTSAALLASEVQRLEMQLGVEEREFSAGSGRVSLLRAQLEEARRQLKKYDDGGVGEYVIALKNVPEVGRTLAGLLREVKLLETVSAYLRQQLEQERISEQRDLPTLQVLDSAVVPDTRSSPSRFSMLLLGLFSGLFLSFFYIAWRDFNEDVRRNPEGHIRYLNLRATLLRRNGNKVRV